MTHSLNVDFSLMLLCQLSGFLLLFQVPIRGGGSRQAACQVNVKKKRQNKTGMTSAAYLTVVYKRHLCWSQVSRPTA